MIINANTKLAAVLKQQPDALEAIISICPKFVKLRNPILRKLMAGRTTLAMAAKIGACSVNNFFDKLKPLGFDIDAETLPVYEEKKALPDFVTSLQPSEIIDLDVRPVIAAGKDPLNLIIEKIKTIQPGQVLKIINSFEPIPLILLLEKRGFISYTDIINENLTETYFHKKMDALPTDIIIPAVVSNGWDDVMDRFKNRVETIDVRALEMPLPMLTILDALENLPAETALLVHHKRIPVFLLPELAEKKFDYRINEIRDGEVDILIFKN
jgi:TusA-related sulfurtransferase